MPAAAYARCGGCDEDPALVWSVESILQWQKVSDLLISLAYFSIPLELLYFATSAGALLPFRWLFLQFGAFIVLCGLTHLAATFSYSPHSFHLLLAATALKFATALVSLATALSLLPVLPQLLRLFVRDGLLRQKARDLHLSLRLMRRHEAASSRVRMLTAHIRRSLDRHTILDTTLLHLSSALHLHDCAIWMPTSPSSLSHARGHSLPTTDAHLASVVAAKGVVFLPPNSSLVATAEAGPVAAIRMPLLRVSNFDTVNQDSTNTCSPYAILVLVLPPHCGREWTEEEVAMIEAVADQVTIALSHAAVLEESMVVREKLLQQNIALERARQEALLAREARDSSRSMIARKISGPIRSVAAVLSVLQLEKLSSEQLALIRGGVMLSSLIEEAAPQVTESNDGKWDLRPRAFHVRFIIEEALALARICCFCKGVSFEYRVIGENPGVVVGDETRILQAVLCLVDSVLGREDAGNLFLEVLAEEDGTKLGSCDKSKSMIGEQNSSHGIVELSFDVGRIGSHKKDDAKVVHKLEHEVSRYGRSLLKCERLAKLMQGNVAISSPSPDFPKNVKLFIRLQQRQPGNVLHHPSYSDLETARGIFTGMRVLLLDTDYRNIALTRKLCQKLGCDLFVVSSWYHCLEILHVERDQVQLLLIDLHILEEDRSKLSDRIGKLRMENGPLIVALTTSNDRATKEGCIQGGIRALLCKPIILREMVDQLQPMARQINASTPF